MKPFTRFGIATAAIVALAAGGCENGKGAAKEAGGIALDATLEAGKGLAVELCPLGVSLVAEAASGNPVLAAVLRASAAASCVALEAHLASGTPVPASRRTGLPDFCALPKVNAGETVALQDGTGKVLTAEEAAAFNAALDTRCR